MHFVSLSPLFGPAFFVSAASPIDCGKMFRHYHTKVIKKSRHTNTALLNCKILSNIPELQIEVRPIAGKKTKFPFKWYDAFLLRVLPPIVAMFIKLLMLSCRVIRVEGRQRETEAIENSCGAAIYVTWHQRMSYHFHYFGARHVTVMISQSRDGEYAARVAKWLGFKNVRGSSTRGGMDALRELAGRIRHGDTGGMLADGPRGPARVAKIGSIILSRDTQAPLIPILWSTDRCWILNSWDRYMIPKPFSRLVFYYGEPITVPISAKKKDLEEYRLILEERLNQGTKWCDSQFGPERPWRKEKR
ncbi:conserved hypothetical protein [uncultured Desulfobacterium sp.]|uniref:DUF374 domain-containing protein n=1 Tax=uncultured Desulfobacterium sp. TaxID=201089 RepID=A0A445N2H3_9BACT|nr:conserved hypothetical protein [uncultured Desulfobacterium sp.]